MNDGTESFRKAKTNTRRTKHKHTTHQKNKIRSRTRKNVQEAKAKQAAHHRNNQTLARTGTVEQKVAIAMTQVGNKDTAIGNKAGPQFNIELVVITPTKT